MRNYRNCNRTRKNPRRPFERERLDRELKLCGEYGLRCKKEIWRVNLFLSKLRRTARTLLTLSDDHPRRQLEGAALLRRCQNTGLLSADKNKLDYVLSLTVPDILERRLQTVVFKLGIAKSIHHARVMVRQRHIAVGKQIVTVPSFTVRVGSEKQIALAAQSPMVSGKTARCTRVKAGKKKGGGGGGDDE
eukprot:PhF_6_TR8906/c0_g1_i2/m.14067/K02997/RP-S9e, RPS9; small subunit ribosomal protein S9e